MVCADCALNGHPIVCLSWGACARMWDSLTQLNSLGFFNVSFFFFRFCFTTAFDTVVPININIVDECELLSWNYYFMNIDRRCCFRYFINVVDQSIQHRSTRITVTKYQCFSADTTLLRHLRRRILIFFLALLIRKCVLRKITEHIMRVHAVRCVVHMRGAAWEISIVPIFIIIVVITSSVLERWNFILRQNTYDHLHPC